MPAVATHIPEALWSRLAALDARCDTFMRRGTEWETGRGWSSIRDSNAPATRRRAWHVRISLADSTPTHGYGLDKLIDRVEPTLAEALTLAVTEAEARGWHKPP